MSISGSREFRFWLVCNLQIALGVVLTNSDAVWGRGDPAFIYPGAEAFKQDSPDATVRFVDAGHFALETKRWEVARIVRVWLTGIGY